MANKFTIITKQRNYTFGPQIIKLEKKCFDWRCKGRDSTVVDDGYEATDYGSYVRVKHKTHIIKSIYFSRPADYKKNILFSLTELLSNIVSFFRVLALNLIVFAIVAIIIFGVLMDNTKVIEVIVGIYASLIGTSLVLAGLGYLWRKVFRLSEKTDEYYEENGYKAWSEYENEE